MVVFLISLGSLSYCDEKKPAVAIQPLGRVNPALVETVRRGILSLYNVEVTVLPGGKLPSFAWYPPRQRYRAEKLLRYLEDINKGRYAKIIGFTAVDISTTKGEIKDWGIFGLGSMGGEACVVSTFRLGRGQAPRQLFLQRLVKVVNHELGHAYGLDHCLVRGCIMEDAKGTIRTVDRETGRFCDRCRRKLGNLVK